ncbi:MAG TPA: TAXI family TRAP transporter solute-binding subunit [Bacteroidales bacterium]|nr:TAXI family TRAP transporter solute-binding subunit [Bacteroidales bacterium]
MKKKLTTIIGVILSSSLILAACGGSGNSVKLATGGNTGTYYSFGTAISQIIGEKEDISFNIQSTGASKANIQLIDAGEVDMAIVQNDVMDYAYNGTDLFVEDGAVNSFSAMAAVYAEVVQIIANPSSGIESIEDLRGKSVSVGDAGSGVEFNAKQILEAYGISFDDISKQNLSFSASADAYKDGKIDAFFATAGAPTTAIMDLVTSQDILILGIEDDKADELMASYPFYTVFDIPGGTYTGVDEDVKTLAVKATFIVSNNLDEDTVYNMTKALFENKDEIVAAHAKGRELDLNYAVEGISIPFHSGAEKYFREAGVLN